MEGNVKDETVLRRKIDLNCSVFFKDLCIEVDATAMRAAGRKLHGWTTICTIKIGVVIFWYSWSVVYSIAAYGGHTREIVLQLVCLLT